MKTLDQMIGDQIRTMRLDAEQGEAEFAVGLGMSLARLSMCENGTYRFSAAELRDVCHLLAVQPVQIFAPIFA